tara:strand:+ start:6862 stop:7773 length:912 start_codon:yes stop_codon:yes gene_type:complete
MDEFNKMAEPAGTATQVQGNGMFQGLCAFHTFLTLGVAIIALIEWLAKEDDDTTNTLNTLLATLLVIASANFLLSLLNSIGEWSRPTADKDKLENRILNSARNIMTTLSFILGVIVYGMDTKETTAIFFIAVGVQRLVDCVLDVGKYGLDVQCPGEEGKETSKTIIATFASLAFGGCVALLTVHAIDIGDDMGDDTGLFWGAFSAICLHTVLVLLTLALQSSKGVQEFFAACLSKGPLAADCDGVTVHSLNEIPIVSSLVFTATIGIISLFVGEALESDSSVQLMGAVLVLLALVETAGRRMI